MLLANIPAAHWGGRGKTCSALDRKMGRVNCPVDDHINELPNQDTFESERGCY